MNKIKGLKINGEMDREGIKVGKYRNFDLSIKYDSFFNKYNFILKGKEDYTGEFGTDGLGNITRMDNILDLSLIHISEPTRHTNASRMPSSA